MDNVNNSQLLDSSTLFNCKDWLVQRERTNRDLLVDTVFIRLFCALRIPIVDLLKQRLGNVSHRVVLIYVHAKPTLDEEARVSFRNARVREKRISGREEVQEKN